MQPARAGVAVGVLLLLLGAAVLTGWLLRLPGLLQVMPGHVAMVLNTALCFTLAGLALLIPRRWSHWYVRLQITLGVLIGLIASVMLIQHLTNISLGIDLRSQHVWSNDPNPTPGRMAPNTALAFLLAAGAFLLMPHTAGRTAGRAIEALAFAIILIGLTGAVGYALKLEFLYGWYHHYTRMALSTAAGMILLGIGLWSARPNTHSSQSQTHHRIIWVGGSVFFSIALVAGSRWLCHHAATHRDHPAKRLAQVPSKPQRFF